MDFSVACIGGAVYSAGLGRLLICISLESTDGAWVGLCSVRSYCTGGEGGEQCEKPRVTVLLSSGSGFARSSVRSGLGLWFCHLT